MTNYTDEQRREAVDAYIEHGTAEASRRTGVSGRTIRRWAEDAGLSQARAEKTDAARKQLEAQYAERRANIRLMLLDATEAALRDAIESSRGRKDQMTAAAIGIDKLRLEEGEATSRTATMNESEMDRELVRTLDEWRRQLKTSS